MFTENLSCENVDEKLRKIRENRIRQIEVSSTLLIQNINKLWRFFFTYSKIGTVAFEISRQKSTFVSFILNVIFSVKIQCKFSLATLKLSLENGFNLVVAQATWLKVICIEGQQQEGGNKCVAFWWWCNNVFQGQKNGNNNLRAIHFKSNLNRLFQQKKFNA